MRVGVTSYPGMRTQANHTAKTFALVGSVVPAFLQTISGRGEAQDKVCWLGVGSRTHQRHVFLLVALFLERARRHRQFLNTTAICAFSDRCIMQNRPEMSSPYASYDHMLDRIASYRMINIQSCPFGCVDVQRTSLLNLSAIRGVAGTGRVSIAIQ